MPLPNRVGTTSRELARDRIYAQLKDWIVEGTLEPGERLVDDEIAHYFQTSRTPVREAIQKLSEYHLVIVEPGKTTQVAPLHLESLEEWYRTMAALQSLAAEAASQKSTKEDVDQLNLINEQFAVSIQEKERLETLKLDAQFHAKITKVADMQIVTEFSQRLMVYIHRVAYSHFIEEQHDIDSAESHQRLIEAIQDRDPEKAATCMKQNWMVAMEKVRDKLHQIEQ